MAGLPSWMLPRRQNTHPWPRRRFRRWARSNDPATIGALLGAIPSLPRAELARLTERLIDRLDQLDGDLDIEPNGDELDGHMGEDDFCPHSADCWGYAGDPEDAEDDNPDACEASDDDIRGGLSLSSQLHPAALSRRIGDDVDAEPDGPAVSDHLEQERARA